MELNKYYLIEVSKWITTSVQYVITIFEFNQIDELVMASETCQLELD